MASGATLPLPCVTDAVVAKSPALPCVPATVMAKTLPFLRFSVPWSEREDAAFDEAVRRWGRDWGKVTAHIGTRSREKVKDAACALCLPCPRN